jgi:hypothetical protein
MQNSEKRLKILSDEEIEGIYGRPRFTKEERGQYEISDIGSQALTAESDNFIRLETLGEGDRIVCNATVNLSTFRQYDIGGKLHSSRDGQKFETRIATINARSFPEVLRPQEGYRFHYPGRQPRAGKRQDHRPQ